MRKINLADFFYYHLPSLSRPSTKKVKLYRTRLGNYYLPTGIKTDMIINTMRKGELFEPEVVEVARRYIRKGSTVLDLGANLGQMSLIFSKLVGESGRVYAFEAEENICRILRMNIEANDRLNIIPICKAVWDSVGEKKFYPEPDFSRFGTYGSYGIDPRAMEGRIVETITIDSLEIRDPISFMKVDVQGSDLFALRGARETILRNRMPILFEYEEQFQAEFGTCFEDYMKFIDSIGYQIVEKIQDINYLVLPKEGI